MGLHCPSLLSAAVSHELGGSSTTDTTGHSREKPLLCKADTLAWLQKLALSTATNEERKAWTHENFN